MYWLIYPMRVRFQAKYKSEQVRRKNLRGQRDGGEVGWRSRNEVWPSGRLPPVVDPVFSQSVSDYHSCGSYTEKPGPEKRKPQFFFTVLTIRYFLWIKLRTGSRSGVYCAELDASDTVAQLVKWRGPAHDAHHIGNNQQNPASDARFSRKPDLGETRDTSITESLTRLREGGATATETDMEGELAREVVHAAGVHQAQSVSHRLGAQHTLACDGAEAAVGQSSRHDAGALAGHLDGAQLMRRGRK